MCLLQLQETNNLVSVSDYYRAIKRFFNWLMEEGVLESNTMASIHPPKVPSKVVQPFSMKQIADVLLLCDDGTFLGAEEHTNLTHTLSR